MKFLKSLSPLTTPADDHFSEGCAGKKERRDNQPCWCRHAVRDSVSLSLSLSFSLARSLALSLSLSVSLSFSLYLSRSLSHTLSLSFSLSHTHTHIHTYIHTHAHTHTHTHNTLTRRFSVVWTTGLLARSQQGFQRSTRGLALRGVSTPARASQHQPPTTEQDRGGLEAKSAGGKSQVQGGPEHEKNSINFAPCGMVRARPGAAPARSTACTRTQERAAREGTVVQRNLRAGRLSRTLKSTLSKRGPDWQLNDF